MFCCPFYCATLKLLLTIQMSQYFLLFLYCATLKLLLTIQLSQYLWLFLLLCYSKQKQILLLSVVTNDSEIENIAYINKRYMYIVGKYIIYLYELLKLLEKRASAIFQHFKSLWYKYTK
jgi:hypothetical protein